jgi:carbon monoxide dehydrogenase subunit G
MVQKVGHVKTRLELGNRLTDIRPLHSVTVISEGEDPRLRATVRTEQSFELSSKGQYTEINISADIHVTGKIATFGGRIILAKAEQIVVSALENVSELLQQRGMTVDPQRAIER